MGGLICIYICIVLIVNSHDHNEEFGCSLSFLDCCAESSPCQSSPKIKPFYLSTVS